jgi:hypothetical protein
MFCEEGIAFCGVCNMFCVGGVKFCVVGGTTSFGGTVCWLLLVIMLGFKFGWKGD